MTTPAEVLRRANWIWWWGIYGGPPRAGRGHTKIRSYLHLTTNGTRTACGRDLTNIEVLPAEDNPPRWQRACHRCENLLERAIALAEEEERTDE